jgi:hypothetical protein
MIIAQPVNSPPVAQLKCSLQWPKEPATQFPSTFNIVTGYNLTVPSHLLLGFPARYFPSGFRTKFIYLYLFNDILTDSDYTASDDLADGEY